MLCLHHKGWPVGAQGSSFGKRMDVSGAVAQTFCDSLPAQMYTFLKMAVYCRSNIKHDSATAWPFPDPKVIQKLILASESVLAWVQNKLPPPSTT